LFLFNLILLQKSIKKSVTGPRKKCPFPRLLKVDLLPHYGVYFKLEYSLMNGRTPRNYNGTERPGKTIGDLASQFLFEVSKKSLDPILEIAPFWAEIMGEKMGSLTQIVSFVDGVLTVKVKSSTLYSLLCQHERPRLIVKLQERFSVKNIVFRRM
jgi:hypothetical protein